MLSTIHIQEGTNDHFSTIVQIRRKAEVWGSWSPMKSFLRQEEIEQDIERLKAGIDGMLLKLSVSCFLVLAISDDVTNGFLDSEGSFTAVKVQRC